MQEWWDSCNEAGAPTRPQATAIPTAPTLNLLAIQNKKLVSLGLGTNSGSGLEIEQFPSVEGMVFVKRYANDYTFIIQPILMTNVIQYVYKLFSMCFN